VTQVLNKRGGPFTAEDESRLRAFTAQISIALENAKLFADVQNMKNYSEAMLESMSNGVLTLDEHGTIVTCNTAGLRILRAGRGQGPATAGERLLRRQCLAARSAERGRGLGRRRGPDGRRAHL
jgi:nitrogen fixation/metabolism regulation signal transduction histidine kinase